MQLPGKNLLARFSISSLGNRKLNICCANLVEMLMGYFTLVDLLID